MDRSTNQRAGGRDDRSARSDSFDERKASWESASASSRRADAARDRRRSRDFLGGDEQANRRRHELPRRPSGDRVGPRGRLVSDAQVRDKLARISARPAAEWAKRVEQEFPSDPAMRMQALLWLHSEKEGPDLGGPPSLGEAADERYELTLRLDTGTSASVWQAFDRRLGRSVAIKIFRQRDESDALDQVIAEARAASEAASRACKATIAARPVMRAARGGGCGRHAVWSSRGRPGIRPERPWSPIAGSAGAGRGAMERRYHKHVHSWRCSGCTPIRCLSLRGACASP